MDYNKYTSDYIKDTNRNYSGQFFTPYSIINKSLEILCKNTILIKKTILELV
jgi:hypothetical protein